MKNLKFTLKAWPVIAVATIGLCFLTQQIAMAFGIELPDQLNVDIVRRCLSRTFDSWKAFLVSAMLVAQVVLLMPALEELIFSLFLFKLPGWGFPSLGKGAGLVVTAAVSSALFSAAHYYENAWPDNAFLALFFFGLAQCWLYRRTSALWCAILNHALFNIVNLTLLVCFPEMAKG